MWSSTPEPEPTGLSTTSSFTIEGVVNAFMGIQDYFVERGPSPSNDVASGAVGSNFSFSTIVVTSFAITTMDAISGPTSLGVSSAVFDGSNSSSADGDFFQYEGRLSVTSPPRDVVA